MPSRLSGTHNSVLTTIWMVLENGRRSHTLHIYHVSCLPGDFAGWWVALLGWAGSADPCWTLA